MHPLRWMSRTRSLPRAERNKRGENKRDTKKKECGILEREGNKEGGKEGINELIFRGAAGVPPSTICRKEEGSEGRVCSRKGSGWQERENAAVNGALTVSQGKAFSLRGEVQLGWKNGSIWVDQKRTYRSERLRQNCLTRTVERQGQGEDTNQRGERTGSNKIICNERFQGKGKVVSTERRVLGTAGTQLERN